MNKENEKLDQIFRDMISDYPTPPPDHIWETIAKKWQKKGFLFSWGIAASLLILMAAGFSAYWIFWHQNPNGPEPLMVENPVINPVPEIEEPLDANPLAVIRSTEDSLQKDSGQSTSPGKTYKVKAEVEPENSEPEVVEFSHPPIPAIKTMDFIAMAPKVPEVNLEYKITSIQSRPEERTQKPGVLRNLGEEFDQVGVIFGNLREAKDQFFSFNFKKESNAN